MATVSVRVVGRCAKWNFGHSARRRCGEELTTDAPFKWQVIVGVTFEPGTDLRSATSGLLCNGWFYTIGMPPVPPPTHPDTVSLMHEYTTVSSKPTLKIELRGTSVVLVADVPPLPCLDGPEDHACSLCSADVTTPQYIAGCGHWFHTACVCARLDSNGDVGFPCPACAAPVEDVISSYRNDT